MHVVPLDRPDHPAYQYHTPLSMFHYRVCCLFHVSWQFKSVVGCCKRGLSYYQMPSPQYVDVTDAVEDVLGLSFPRCCVCDAGWYDAIEGGEDDLDVQSKKRKRNRCRPSHDMLLPMPPCQCATKLVLPGSVPQNIYSEKECSDPMATLSQIKTLSLPNLAICKACLEHRIKASSEVTVHDYRQEHIPNGQQNVKFTVEPDCVQCKRKFMQRVLERLLASNGESSQPRAGKGKGKTNVKWSDAIKSTIDVVGWVKRERRRDRRSRRRKERTENTNNTLENNAQRKTIWEIHNCDGNGSSDDCYSCSSDESSDDEIDNRRKEPHRVESAQGELAQYLAEKDPKFKQALEDEQFAKKLAEEEEKERQKELEARAEEDLKIAKELQAEFEKNSKKAASKIEPRKTRRSPIVEAMKKASTLNERTPTPSNRQEVVQQAKPASKAQMSQSISVSRQNKKNQDATKKPKTDDHDDEISVKVREIMNMGFSEGSARRCLKDSDGNVEVAVSMLLSDATMGASGSPVRKAVERSVTIRIMFTGFIATRQHMQMIETIGATIVESIEEAHTATHVIVTDGKTKLRRTPKLMVCICKSPNIVKLEWLEQSAKEQRVLDTTPYLLIDDKEAEKRYNFSMKDTIQNGIQVREKGGVLGGLYVYICSGVAGNQAPSTKELNLIIEAAGGNVLSSLSTSNTNPAKTIVLTSDPCTHSQLREPGVKNIPQMGGKIVSTSWLFHVIITQCINPVIEVD